jgi:hypothetical protein
MDRHGKLRRVVLLRKVVRVQMLRGLRKDRKKPARTSMWMSAETVRESPKH